MVGLATALLHCLEQARPRDPADGRLTESPSLHGAPSLRPRHRHCARVARQPPERASGVKNESRTSTLNTWARAATSRGRALDRHGGSSSHRRISPRVSGARKGEQAVEATPPAVLRHGSPAVPASRAACRSSSCPTFRDRSSGRGRGGKLGACRVQRRRGEQCHLWACPRIGEQQRLWPQ